MAEWVAGDSHIFILAQCKGDAPLKILASALKEEPATSEAANLNTSRPVGAYQAVVDFSFVRMFDWSCSSVPSTIRSAER